MTLKKTPLNDKHRSMGGRMVPFAGWDMPVQYTSIVEEHMHVRNKAGIFDVSHMGEIIVKGEDATSFLESVTCNNISDLYQGRVQYNALMNDNGGLVDDLTIYMLSENQYFICANASNTEAVFLHLSQKSKDWKVEIRNESESWHQIAVQGPVALKLTESIFGMNLSDIDYYHFRDVEFDGKSIRLSRTGYTGEDGFEIYSTIPQGLNIWNRLLSAPEEYRPIPIGLGARDSLRLEVRYPLYGHELGPDMTPVESGIGWIVKEKEIPYPHMNEILLQKKNGTDRRVAGFQLETPGIPREHYAVYNESGTEKIGEVLSGGHSPVLKRGIGTAIVPYDYFREERSIMIEIRNKMTPAKIQKGPFVKGSAGVK